MTENRVRLNVDLQNFTLKDRLMARMHGSPKIMELNRLPAVVEAVDDLGFSFVRAELPKSMASHDLHGKEIAYSRNIMLRVTKSGTGYDLVQVPGLHVVTGLERYNSVYDPFVRFSSVLNEGFEGGKRINTDTQFTF